VFSILDSLPSSISATYTGQCNVQETCTNILGKNGSCCMPSPGTRTILFKVRWHPGPLFLIVMSKWLTRQAFGKALNEALEELHVVFSQIIVSTLFE